MACKKLKDEDDFSAVMCWDSMSALDSINSPQAGLLCDGICPVQTNRLVFFLPVASLPGLREEELRRRREEKEYGQLSPFMLQLFEQWNGRTSSGSFFLEEHLGSDAFQLCGLEHSLSLAEASHQCRDWR